MGSYLVIIAVLIIFFCFRRRKRTAVVAWQILNQRKWERLSARGKNDKEKPLLHGWDAFHVAAVLTVVIISFVFLISGDNLFLPLVRPV